VVRPGKTRVRPGPGIDGLFGSLCCDFSFIYPTINNFGAEYTSREINELLTDAAYTSNFTRIHEDFVIV